RGCRRSFAPYRAWGDPCAGPLRSAASLTCAGWRRTGGRMRKLKLDLESLTIESFATELADARPRGTVAGRMVPADSYDCGYTEAECHGGGGGGGGGTGSGLTLGWTCGHTCDQYECGP